MCLTDTSVYIYICVKHFGIANFKKIWTNYTISFFQKRGNNQLQYSYKKAGSVLAFSTQILGFKPDRSRRNFRAKKSSARLPSEGK
jgi:hypothetical protein